jgi:sugar phosphate isomerase/epimerase
MIRYSYSVLPYGEEPLEQSFERVARYGYDCIELLGDPGTFGDIGQIDELQRKYEVSVRSICMIYTSQTDLVSSDPSIREHTRAYIRDMIDRASEAGVEIIPITPTANMKIRPEAELEEEWRWAREAIREAGEHAQRAGVRVVIEPWNRYETYLITRLEQAVQIAREVELDNVGVKGDLFHMNIEEESIPAAIRSAGSLLWHMDFADSTRAAPGRGHIDFETVMGALSEIDFDGIINMELLPAAGDPFLSIKGGSAEEFKEEYTSTAISHVKAAATEAGIG